MCIIIPVFFCNWDTTCSPWERKGVFKYYLDKFQVSEFSEAMPTYETFSAGHTHQTNGCCWTDEYICWSRYEITKLTQIITQMSKYFLRNKGEISCIHNVFQNIVVLSFLLWRKITSLWLKWLVTREITWYSLSLPSTHFYNDYNFLSFLPFIPFLPFHSRHFCYS